MEIMGALSDDLEDMGYTPTGRESPVDDEGELWSNGYEAVCDETGTVISSLYKTSSNGKEDVYRYQNSERVKMPGGYISKYFEGDGIYGEH